MPPRCPFSDTGNVAVAPSRPRHTTTDTSNCSGRRRSSTQATRPIAFPGGARGVDGGHAFLPLAVVAEARGLQDAGQQRRIERIEILGALDHRVRRDVDAARRDEALLGDPVLRDRDAGRLPG